MTQRDLDAIKLLKEECQEERNRFELLRLEHVKRMEHLNKELNIINKKCNHVYPCGKNASENAFMYSYCKICGITDL